MLWSQYLYKKITAASVRTLLGVERKNRAESEGVEKVVIYELTQTLLAVCWTFPSGSQLQQINQNATPLLFDLWACYCINFFCFIWKGIRNLRMLSARCNISKFLKSVRFLFGFFYFVFLDFSDTVFIISLKLCVILFYSWMHITFIDYELVRNKMTKIFKKLSNVFTEYHRKLHFFFPWVYIQISSNAILNLWDIVNMFFCLQNLFNFVKAGIYFDILWSKNSPLWLTV